MTTLSKKQAEAAATYNAGRGYSAELVAKIKALVGSKEAGFGVETARAAAAWQQHEGLDGDGKIGPSTLDEMYAAWQSQERGEQHGDASYELARAAGTEDGSNPDIETANDDITSNDWFVDMRSKPRTKERGKPKGIRDWSTITGITLHQTSVVFGGPKHHGIINIPAHGMTFGNGQIVLLNPPNALMWHGNGFNEHDIGIEIDCHACGVEGVYNVPGKDRPNTFWRPESRPNCRPVEVSDAQIEATKRLVRYYVDLVASKGGKIRYVHAHRQSADKLSDPGSRIWKNIGVWAQKEFGLTTETTGTDLRGKGHPIPTAWDPEIEGVPYSSSYRGY